MLKKFLQKAQIHPLRRRLQQQPYYRFQSFEELQLAASWGIHIEANTASVDDWLRLPGLSIHQARSLRQLVEQGVAFYCIEDIAAALAIPLQQVQPWEPMLQFCYYGSGRCSEQGPEQRPEQRLEPMAIDVNTATAEQLATIPAVDIVLGRAIAQTRKNGPYKNLADLQSRLRLTAQVTTELLHYLKFK